MRAMPSPTEMTNPVSETLTALLVIFDLFAENSRYLVCSNLSHIPLILLNSCLTGQPAAHAMFPTASGPNRRTRLNQSGRPHRRSSAGSIEKSHRTCLPETRDNSLLQF